MELEAGLLDSNGPEEAGIYAPPSLVAERRRRPEQTRYGAMAPWHNDTMAPWHHGTMAPWHHDAMRPWRHEAAAPWCSSGAMSQRRHDAT